MVFSSKDKIKIQEYVTERAYPVSTVILITLIYVGVPFLLKVPFYKRLLRNLNFSLALHVNQTQEQGSPIGRVHQLF